MSHFDDYKFLQFRAAVLKDPSIMEYILTVNYKTEYSGIIYGYIYGRVLQEILNNVPIKDAIEHQLNRKYIDIALEILLQKQNVVEVDNLNTIPIECVPLQIGNYNSGYWAQTKALRESMKKESIEDAKRHSIVIKCNNKVSICYI